MPPSPSEYLGPAASGEFLEAVKLYRHGETVGTLLGPRLNGHCSFASYRVNPETGVGMASGLMLLRTSPGGITRLTYFIGQEYVEAVGLPGSIGPAQA